jgi:hypothetical protein
MKNFKHILMILVLCSINAMDARVRDVAKAPVTPSPTTQVVQPQPVVQPRPMPIMPQQIVAHVQPIIKKTGDIGMYLVPIAANTLRTFDLCPLFAQQEISKLTAQELKDFRSQGYTEAEIKSFTFQGVSPHYSVFNEKRELLLGGTRSEFETKDVAVNVPCNVQLGRYGNWNRALMQLKSLDQFELADKTGFSMAMCGGLSLNNGRLIRNYVLTGNEQSLYNVHNISDAAGFLRKIKIGDWLNAEVLRRNLVNLTNELGFDGTDVSVVSTVSLFDSNLDKQSGFGLFDEDEFAYAQKVKKNIREGLKKDNYVHIMIIGNEETVEKALGHYFCFAIIKAGNEIQYVVLDTVPSTYHLQTGSHERDRLMFVINNIEQGNSTIKIANIRVKRLQILEEERKASLKK